MEAEADGSREAPALGGLHASEGSDAAAFAHSRGEVVGRSGGRQEARAAQLHSPSSEPGAVPGSRASVGEAARARAPRGLHPPAGAGRDDRAGNLLTHDAVNQTRLAARLPPSFRWIAAWGPGLVVMLADTDAGNVVTAAQAGAQWGYRLLPLLFLLIAPLYAVQALTVRLGIFTGRGHGELIREHFGPAWAWLSIAGLGIATVGSLVTEFTAVAGGGRVCAAPRRPARPAGAASPPPGA